MLPNGKSFQAFECVGHILSSESESEMIAGIPELSPGQDQDAFLFNQLRGKLVHVAIEHPWKRDAPGLGPDPLESFLISFEERVEHVEVRADDRLRSLDQPLASAQRDEREDLARCAAADRRVVLQRRDARPK